MLSRKLIVFLFYMLCLQLLVACDVFETHRKSTPLSPPETTTTVSVATSVPLATASSPSQLTSPVPSEISSDSDFLKRQFDPSQPFFDTRAYPEKLTLISETDLVSMRCTKEYFSWTGADYNYVDEITHERHELTDAKLQSYLKNIKEMHSGQSATSILSCEVENGRTIVFYRVGPCGGGCAGIPHFAYGKSDGTLELIAEVPYDDGNGAYVGCYPAQLTKDDTLYITCIGEGVGTIRKIDLHTNSVSVLLRCQALDSPMNCEPD